MQRFAVSLKKTNGDHEVWLSFIPRLSQPPAPYREAVLILSRGDWRPRALKLVDSTVVAGGIADAAGIRPNDILVGLHVWELRGQEDLDYALKQIAAMNAADNSPMIDSIAVVLIREGEIMKTTIKPKP